MLPNGTLKIANVTRRDAASYTCIAKNQFGTASTTGRLLITGECCTSPITTHPSLHPPLAVLCLLICPFKRCKYPNIRRQVQLLISNWQLVTLTSEMTTLVKLSYPQLIPVGRCIICNVIMQWAATEQRPGTNSKPNQCLGQGH